MSDSLEEASTKMLPNDPKDLLNDEQQQSLNKDLAEMAKKRRLAEGSAGGISLG